MKFNFTMGADPEFNLTLFDRRLHAEQTINATIRDTHPYGDSEMGYMIKKAGEIGWDGCSATAELRPRPSSDPYKVAKNIGDIIKATHKSLPYLDMIATNELAPVGGHIHMTLGPQYGIDGTQIKTAIDYLNILFLPIMMSENKISEKIRLHNEHYGQLGDHRVDTIETRQGDKHKIEYRTPNAEWIISPKICRATMAYIAVCWNAIMNKPEKIKQLETMIIPSAKDQKTIQKLILNDNQDLQKDVLKKIRKFVFSLPEYQNYKQDINYILQPKKVIKDKEKHHFNLVLGWNLTKKKQLTASIVKRAEKLAEEGMEKLNIDFEEDEIEMVPHNKDHNCESFATKLGALMATQHIFKRHEYFIFGLKNGIESPIVMNQDKNFFKGLEQCETINDYNTIKDTFFRMLSRAQERNAILNNLNSKNKQLLLIGLPYKMRLRNQFKNFLSLIKDLEYEPFFTKQTPPTSHRNAEDLPGKIFTLYHTRNNAPRQDTQSQGFRMSQRALQEITH